MRKIYSSRDYEDYLDDARDYIQENETEDDLNDMALMMCNDDWNYFYHDILDNYFKSHKCMIGGTIGRWDGEIRGWTITENEKDFWELMEDVRDIELWDDNGYLTIIGYHHDGKNQFLVKELTGKAYEWYKENAWYKDSKEVGKYLNLNFNSHKPNIEWSLNGKWAKEI